MVAVAAAATFTFLVLPHYIGYYTQQHVLFATCAALRCGE